jgi:hypothetical protein
MKQPPDTRGSTGDEVHDASRIRAEQQIEIDILRGIVLELMEDHRQVHEALDEERRSNGNQAREIDALRQSVRELTAESKASRLLRHFIRKCAGLGRAGRRLFRNGSLS